MKHVAMMLSVSGLVLALTMPGWAQVIKELPEQTVTIEGTVEDIDYAKRHLSIKTAEGKVVAVDAPNAKRFKELKVGDKVKVTYSGQVIVKLKKPGEPAVNRAYTAKAPGTGEGRRPGGTAAMHRIMTVTITEIDKGASSITFEGPNKWKYSRRVVDPTVLDKVKVGDRVDIIWNIMATVEVS